MVAVCTININTAYEFFIVNGYKVLRLTLPALLKRIIDLDSSADAKHSNQLLVLKSRFGDKILKKLSGLSPIRLYGAVVLN